MEAEGNNAGELVAALCYLKHDAMRLNAPRVAALIDLARMEAEALRSEGEGPDVSH